LPVDDLNHLLINIDRGYHINFVRIFFKNYKRENMMKKSNLIVMMLMLLLLSTSIADAARRSGAQTRIRREREQLEEAVQKAKEKKLLRERAVEEYIRRQTNAKNKK
jgi:biopolymer transport protein ExbB/TolQ